MPVYHSGQSRLVWHAIFESALRGDSIEPQDRKITLISPWISDLTSSKSGWSTNAIDSAMDDWEGSVESLSDVLGALVHRGFEVTVVTLSTTGKWLRKKVDDKLEHEIEFMKKLTTRGVTCLISDNIHMKYISTPFCILSGSLNLSFNGVHGRNQEATNLFYHGTPDYDGALLGINNVLVGARDYQPVDGYSIADWSLPEFDWFLEEIESLPASEDVDSDLEEQDLIPSPDAEETCTENPYTPTEMRDGPISQDSPHVHQYLCAKFIQILQRIGSYVLSSLNGKMNLDAYTVLEDAISPTLGHPDIGEILPSINGILLGLSEEHFPSHIGDELRVLVTELRGISRSVFLQQGDTTRLTQTLDSIEHRYHLIIIRGV